MFIPTATKAATLRPLNDEEPTLPGSDASKLWSDAATALSRKLVECARIKQRCYDVLDTDGSRVAYKMAKELTELARVLDGLPALQPELAAVVRRGVVDRLIKLCEESKRVLPLTNAA